MPNWRIQYRIDTTANWEAANPILLDGEAGYERTEGGLVLCKIGDGIRGADGNVTGTAWNDLPYVSGPAGPQGDIPAHEWLETSLRFQNPDGSWELPVNLIGPRGPQGLQGPQGEQGEAGTDKPATKVTLGGIIVGDNLEITPDGCLSAMGSLPCGGILAFGGSFGGSDNRRPIDRRTQAPNENWVLCDGGSDGLGGTVPDLRNRFIRGHGIYAIGETGGDANHSHTINGNVGATTLNANTQPRHAHTARLDAGYYDSFGNLPSPQPFGSGAYNWGSRTSDPTNYVGNSTAHTHSLNVVSSVASNLPPFYALAFIMRIK